MEFIGSALLYLLTFALLYLGISSLIISAKRPDFYTRDPSKDPLVWMAFVSIAAAVLILFVR